MRSRGVVSLATSACCALLVTAVAYAQVPAAKKIDPNLQAIAETERAFAKFGAEKGVRESFLAYFADDGIWFVPEPQLTVPALRSRPALTGPLKRKLEWAPMYGDVSRAGDLGYDTGPSANSDLTPAHGPTRYGYFFSIWKKQPKGDWRVAIDLGSSAPDVWDPAKSPEFRAALPSGWKARGKTILEKETSALIAAEAAFSQSAQTNGMAQASAQFLDVDARWHRNGISPLVGRENVRAFLSKKDFKPHWEPSEKFVAKSADLGYSYGRYWAPRLDENGVEETGYYLHVWRKDARDDWKLVFHVTSPIESPKK